MKRTQKLKKNFKCMKILEDGLKWRLFIRGWLILICWEIKKTTLNIRNQTIRENKTLKTN